MKSSSAVSEKYSVSPSLAQSSSLSIKNIPLIHTWYDSFQEFRIQARKWLAQNTFVDIEQGILSAQPAQYTSSPSGIFHHQEQKLTFFNNLYSLYLEVTVGSREFRQYRQSEFCLIAFSILQILFTAYLVIIATNVYLYFPHISLSIPLVIIFTTTALLGWTDVILNSQNMWLASLSTKPFFQNITTTSNTNTNTTNHKIDPNKYIERIWAILMIACLELHVFFIATQASKNDETDSIYTPKTGRMPDTIMISSMILPTIIYMVVKGTTLRLILICWCSVVISNGIILHAYDMNMSLVPYISMIPFSLFLLIEYHRQNWSSFLITNRLSQVIIVNDRMADEIKSNELRHMIGNVAHDLKTVSNEFFLFVLLDSFFSAGCLIG